MQLPYFKNILITPTESGFRPNWLSSMFPFTMFDKMGKKVEHHQPHQMRRKHYLTATSTGNNIRFDKFSFSSLCTKTAIDNLCLCER